MISKLNSQPPIFVVGNLIHYRQTTGEEYDKTRIFRIDDLRNEPGGNFHDGFTDTTIATITNIKTSEVHKGVSLTYDSMCGYYYSWAILVDKALLQDEK